MLRHQDGLQTHFRTDEVLELIGADFAESFESGNLRVLAALVHGLELLFLAVAVESVLLVPHPEQRRGQHVKMSATNHLREELEEERDHEQTDVHPIHIGIGGQNDVLVTQVIDAFFNVQRRLEEVKLLVLINDLPREAEAVKRLASEREHGLKIHIAAFRDAPTGAVTFGNEERALLTVWVLRIKVDAAITQLLIVQLGLAGVLTRSLLHAADLLALLLVRLDFLKERLRRIGVLVQMIVQLRGHEVDDRAAQIPPTRFHRRTAQLGFGLRFKDRLLNLHAHRRDDTSAHVGWFELLLEELATLRHDRLAESSQVRAALSRVLPVHKAVALLTIAARMGEGHLHIRALQVNDRVLRSLRELVIEQVQQAVLAAELLSVQLERQARIEPRIEAQHLPHEVQPIGEVRLETQGIWMEQDPRAVRLRRIDRRLHVLLHQTLRELDLPRLPIAIRLNIEAVTQRIHRFDPDAVQTDAALESLAIILRTGIDLRRALHEFAQGNAAPIITNRHDVVLDRDLHEIPVTHDVLVDAVIDHLLQQDVNPILRRRAIAQLPDIHPRAEPDVLTPIEGFDGIFVVGRFRHEGEELKGGSVEKWKGVR